MAQLTDGMTSFSDDENDTSYQTESDRNDDISTDTSSVFMVYCNDGFAFCHQGSQQHDDGQLLAYPTGTLNNCGEDGHVVVNMMSTTAPPKSMKKALLLPSSEAAQWQAASDKEAQAFIDRKAHRLIPINEVPDGKTILRSNEILSIKKNMDGTPRKKCRIVADGSKQQMSAWSTFAPVVNHAALRVILAISAARHHVVFHFDISEAFLYASLPQPEYMYPPAGREVFQNGIKMIWKLQSSIYGLVNANCETTRRSITGGAFLLNNAAVHCHSKQQATVSLSSTQSEYHALSSAISQGLFLRQLLAEMNVPQPTTVVHEDNQSTIVMATASALTKKAKHIDVRYHFLREHIEVILQYVSSNDNVADVFTKNVSRPILEYCRAAILGTI